MLEIITKENEVTKLWVNEWYNEKSDAIIYFLSLSISTKLQDNTYRTSPLNVVLSKDLYEHMVEFIESIEEEVNYIEVDITSAWLRPQLHYVGKGKTKKLETKGVELFVNEMTMIEHEDEVEEEKKPVKKLKKGKR